MASHEQELINVLADYMDELGENLDATVIGAYWGEGNRGGRHGSFLVGLRDDDEQPVDGQHV